VPVRVAASRLVASSVWLFFGRVFELVQATYEDMCRAAGIDIQGLMDQHIYSSPIVRVEADFLQPVLVGEEVTVRAVIDRVGDTSVHLSYLIMGEDGSARVRAKVVHVFVDADTWDKVTIPDDVRAAYMRFAAPAE
jgi:acyl-CoA thioester hydrolase